MIKSVNIDGTDYIIRKCYQCIFYYSESGGTRSHCLHPKNRMKNLDDVEYDIVIFPDDCPLGLVKDCCTCKHEERKKEDKWCDPCCRCTITYHADTRVSDPPSKWEAKD